jgi:hypothetical protein
MRHYCSFNERQSIMRKCMTHTLRHMQLYHCLLSICHPSFQMMMKARRNPREEMSQFFSKYIYGYDFNLYANLYNEPPIVAVEIFVAGNMNDREMLFSQEFIVRYVVKSVCKFSMEISTIQKKTKRETYTRINDIIADAKTHVMTVYCVIQYQYLNEEMKRLMTIKHDLETYNTCTCALHF